MSDANKYDNVKRSRKEIFANNLLGGFAWGLGATIGIAIFFAALAFIGTHINFVPIVGNFISDVIAYILTNKPF